jgi:hypothetical protein
MSIFLAGGASKPVKATSNELDARKSVSVYHPGYSPPKLMMILVAFEAPRASAVSPSPSYWTHVGFWRTTKTELFVCWTPMPT